MPATCADGGALGSASVELARSTDLAVSAPEPDGDDTRTCGALHCDDCESPVRCMDGVAAKRRPTADDLAKSEWPPEFVAPNAYSSGYRLYVCRCDFYLMTHGRESIASIVMEHSPLMAPMPSWRCAGHAS